MGRNTIPASVIMARIHCSNMKFQSQSSSFIIKHWKPITTKMHLKTIPISLNTARIHCSVKVNSPFLVVELSLARLEGTQLRALGLLSVFGFNVTYAIRGPGEPAPSSCSAIECRLLGHCYATHDYQEFFCWCMEGYSGADCGVGPLCPRAANTCHHGGTCRQMGPAAVSCLCAPGYTGDLCESQLATPECGIEECSEECRDNVCDCNPKDDDFTSARFETKLQVTDQQNSNISQEILTQVTSYLRASNITLEGDMEILNISEADSTGARSVWLRIWGARREAGAVRTALARLAATIRPKSKLRFLHTNLYFDMQPALTLHLEKKTSPLTANSPNELRATCSSLIVLDGRGLAGVLERRQVAGGVNQT